MGDRHMKLRRSRPAVLAGGAVIAALALAACSSSTTSAPAATGTTAAGGTTAADTGTAGTSTASGTLNGSGSTFQLTFQQAAISAFKSVNANMKVNYSGVGSGTGRANLAAGTVNFAGSDSPIPSSETASFNGKKVLYFPVLLGPIALAYNLSGVSNLKLTPTLIADIFQGKITTWNNAAIKSANPGVTLPSTPITIAVRSDSSGTTQNFALFLQTAVPSVWTLGSSSTVKWPGTARAASGNGGVAQVIKSTSGAIGYVDYTDAKATGLSMASVQNKAGDFVAPSPAGASAAADGVTVASDLTFHAVWAAGAAAYPITYQSWDLVYATQPNANDAAMLKDYIGYLLGPGQQLLTQLYYAPLPSSIQTKAQAQLSQITS
jgi:phosphate transport system substrate-binding protein